jgi:hypothetical protein
MYRIELGPEDIGVFRSIEEMATAIKTGVITSKARIYHSASDKWLPIEFHPHFKKAREMATGPVAPAVVQSPPPRMEPMQPTRRTPLPEPSPVAGLPLIEVSSPSRPAAREVAIESVEHHEPARIPTPVSAPAPATDSDPGPAPMPARAPALWMAPTLPEPAPAPPVVPEPVAIKPPPAPVIFPDEPEAELAPEPVVAYTPWPRMPAPLPAAAPAPALALALAHAATTPVFDHVPPSEPLPLPEPEPEAIFLAAPGETAQEDPTVAARPFGIRFRRVDWRGRRRPILVAVAALTLAASTHFALSANRRQVELGISVPLPVPSLAAGTLNAEQPTPSAMTNATVLPASVPAARGTPSLSAASGFAAIKEPTQPTPAGLAEAAPAPAPAALPVVAPPPKIAIATPKSVPAPSIEGDLKSASGLVARYEAAHAAARTELDNGLRTSGFANLFASSRLQPNGLRAGRAAVGTATAYVQRYRRREAEIEQAYRDSFDVLAARNKWSDGQRRTWESRKVRQEHPEVAKLSGFLLQSLDSLYGLLSAHEAEYRILEGTITFDNAEASRAYGELKPWLDRRAHAWADVDADEPTTAARILRAMGTTKLPEGGTF